MPKISASPIETVTILMSGLAIAISVAALHQGTQATLQDRRANLWIVGAQTTERAQRTYSKAFCSLKAFGLESTAFDKHYDEDRRQLNMIRAEMSDLQSYDHLSLDLFEKRLDQLASADMDLETAIVETKSSKSSIELERFNQMCNGEG